MPKKEKPVEGISVPVEDKLSIKSTLKNDLLGAEDWKRSKIGYLTGFSAFSRMGKSFVGNIGDSYGRTAALWRNLFPPNSDLPELPAPTDGETAYSRFSAAQRQHARSDTDILRSIINTRRSAYFYLAIAFIGLIYASVSIYVWPPTGLIDVAFRFCVPALLLVFTIRAAYTNWMFRNKALFTLREFFLSGEWLPKDNFKK
ncbi:hypothetical protein [Rhizobium sp. MHM7A]|uniref:hypothetical protein n=1 Tax=Rhizobium sp. MHM7A TaxID=2583233 RepID=UPI0011068AA4|nr:hypothetical protein [Rhizobium sp. MHM7A]TLX17121.1 hypothetical protein FFR93_07360 [Rhizobium sp. MHM7A]